MPAENLPKGKAVSLEGLVLSTQASLRIEDKATQQAIHIDPFKVAAPAKTDIIYITHPHFDHLDPKAVEKLYTPGKTSVVAPQECLDSLKMVRSEDGVAVKPGQMVKVKNVPAVAVAAYNQAKDRLHFHPRAKGWVGYVLQVNGQTLYHSGDTDATGEMLELAGSLNLAFLCSGGTYTMSVEEAAQAAITLRADASVPMHLIPVDMKNETKQKQAAEQFKKQVGERSLRADVLGGWGTF
ncbi:MAG: MBL fold metallo-hydrolase [Euryarchaeota archaeon]|nr:MBL fold metallo-hydrolase [Euryarchaeota archaeon]